MPCNYVCVYMIARAVWINVYVPNRGCCAILFVFCIGFMNIAVRVVLVRIMFEFPISAFVSRSVFANTGLGYHRKSSDRHLDSRLSFAEHSRQNN
jgi:hypothetical protein